MSCKHNVGGVRPQPVYLGGKRDVGEVKWQPLFLGPVTRGIVRFQRKLLFSNQFSGM